MERRAFRIGDRMVDGVELFERGALATFSVLAIVLPILDINGSDTSDQILLHDFHLLGAAAYLLPLAFIAGLFGVFAHGMRRHMRFIDLAGLSIAAVAVSRAAYMVVWSLMPVMAPSVEDGPNADALVTVYLSCGSLPLLFVLLGCMRQLRRSWHG